MKAITVMPGEPDTFQIAEVPEPEPSDADLLVEAIAVGICGTDHEIIYGGHGVPPSGRDRLVLGHESLGRVVDAPSGSGFSSGDLVVGIVRRTDPHPCRCCAEGRWDMCLNGQFMERGIKGLDGFASEHYLLEPQFAVPVEDSVGVRGVLVEPASVVTKAWRRTREFAEINCLDPRVALVTGAGPIGLLAALLGAARGLDVHVVDRATDGPKPALVEGLGATYHTNVDEAPAADVVIECTGAPSLAFSIMSGTARNSVVCLTGVPPDSMQQIDVGRISRELVLENDVVIGSVNASRDDYLEAIHHLAAADQAWLDRMITRRVPVARGREAYERNDGDVKTIVDFT